MKACTCCMISYLAARSDMKIKLLLLLACVLLFITVTGQPSPERYAAAISSELKTVAKKQQQYSRAASAGTGPVTIERRRRQLLNTLAASIGRISAMETPPGGTMVRDTVLIYLSVIYSCTNEDFLPPADMQLISEQSFDAMEAYLEARQNAYTRAESAANAVNAAISSFADANGFVLKVNRQKEAEALSSANKVEEYNRLYDLFFTCYKQEAWLLETIAQEDISGIEQNRRALEAGATRGLKRIAKLKASGETPMLLACETLLNFYLNEATEELTGAVAFFTQRDNFVKMKNEFESLSAGQVSGEQLGIFAGALNETTRKREALTERLSLLADRRLRLLHAWHESASDFLARHAAE
jgi:hypothetical protein